MPKRIARWNPARTVWEIPGSESLLCEHSELFSETWPTSGMTRDGSAFTLPVWAPHMAASASSSLLPTPRIGPDATSSEDWRPHLSQVVKKLPTPTAMDGSAWREDGRHYALTHEDGTPTLAGTLLPTPMATEGAPKHKGGNPTLTGALLPTPTAADERSSGGSTPSHVTLTDLVVRMDLGRQDNPRLPTPVTMDASNSPTRQILQLADLVVRADFTRESELEDEPLLPTPAATNMAESMTLERWEEWTAIMKELHGNGNGHGPSLSVEARKLSTGESTSEPSAAGSA